MPVGPMGGLQRAPRVSESESGTTFSYSYSHNDIVENLIAMQILFAGIFEPQNCTLKLLLGSVDPQTHVALGSMGFLLWCMEF